MSYRDVLDRFPRFWIWGQTGILSSFFINKNELPLCAHDYPDIYTDRSSTRRDTCGEEEHAPEEREMTRGVIDKSSVLYHKIDGSRRVSHEGMFTDWGWKQWMNYGLTICGRHECLVLCWFSSEFWFGLKRYQILSKLYLISFKGHPACNRHFPIRMNANRECSINSRILL